MKEKQDIEGLVRVLLEENTSLREENTSLREENTLLCEENALFREAFSQMEVRISCLEAKL
ncbi:MAG: hypothetical protein LBL07_02470 [Tannerella sp.]|jgi:phage shock protein A|nr:hypothetical protein [Tannerella sp.]